MRQYVPPFSFGVVLAVLSAATVVGVGVSIVVHRTILIPFVIGAAFAIGIGFILLFGQPGLEEIPVEGPETVNGTAAASGPMIAPADTGPAENSSAGSGMTEPEPNEPFYDPVEEADRLDSERGSAGTAPSGSDDPK